MLCDIVKLHRLCHLDHAMIGRQGLLRTGRKSMWHQEWQCLCHQSQHWPHMTVHEVVM